MEGAAGCVWWGGGWWGSFSNNSTESVPHSTLNLLGEDLGSRRKALEEVPVSQTKSLSLFHIGPGAGNQKRQSWLTQEVQTDDESWIRSHRF